MDGPDFLPRLTGSFSQPAKDNPTVVMMEAAFRHHSLHFRYLNMDVAPDVLADAVRGAKAMNFAGFNCSLPHKVSVIPLLDGLGESAAVIGAVNCVVRRGESWIGENTDGKGFLESLRPLCEPAGRHVVILGAGGAARAIAVELALAGAARITVVNRDRDRGAELAALVQEHTRAAATFMPWQDDFSVPPDAAIVVNATSVGMHPSADAYPRVDFRSLRPSMTVADVIPNPPQTRFLKEAATRGCQTLDGLGMLVNQGALNLEYWTGTQPEKSVMREALAKAFATD